MEEVRVSIVVPCYNAGKLLPECLDELLAQEYDNKEIIVVDGSSSDGSPELLKRYSAENAHIRWLSEKDRGVYDAMNKGIAMATGEWVYFLGTDDRLYDRRVLSGIFSTGAAAASDIVYGNVEFRYSRQKYNGPYHLRKLLFESNICHQAIFYRRSVFEKVGGYDVDCKVYADRDFNIRCYLHKKLRIKFMDRIIAVYNERDGLSALDGSDPAFRAKQRKYIEDYNNKPVRAFFNGIRRIASLKSTRTGRE